MKRYRVELSAEALEQAQSIRAWWTENRLAAQDLFADELRAAIRKLGAMPRIGAHYDTPDFREMRRILMPPTRYHVYYAVDDESQLVRIHAVWHASRGHAPRE